MMEYSTLASGLGIPMVGFGTWPLKGEALHDAVGAALECGYELFDTATGYGNEADLGRALEGAKGRVLVQSKVKEPTLKGRRRYLHLDKKDMSGAYKASCRRLGYSVVGGGINLYLLHAPFRGCARHYADLMKLQAEGLVGAIGVCNFDIEELERLHDKCGVWPEVNQTEISVFNAQPRLVAFCQQRGICVQGYSPFGRGHLVGEIMGNEVLRDIARECGRTVGQVVIRWVVQRGIVCLVRSTNRQRIEENIDVFDFRLTEGQMERIGRFDAGRVFGVNQVGKRSIVDL